MRGHYEAQKPAGNIACDDTLATRGHSYLGEHQANDTGPTGWRLGQPEA